MNPTTHVRPDGYTYNHLSPETADHLINSRPRSASDEGWAELGPLVRIATAAANPVSPKAVQPMIKIAYDFLVWIRDDAAGEPAIESFTERNIRLFIQQQPDRGKRQNDRRAFGYLARMVEANSGIRPPGNALQRSHAAAYTPAEIARLWSAAISYPTQRMRDNARRILALGLSAGLSTAEMEDLRCGQIVGEEIHLDDRVIPLLDPWSKDIERRDHAPNEYYLLPHQRRGEKSGDVLGSFLSDLGVTRPAPQRLRATFIARLLESPIPGAAILQVAGLKSFTGFDRYLSSLSRPSAASAADTVRRQVIAR